LVPVPVVGQDSVGVGSYAIQGAVVSEVSTLPPSGLTVALFKSDGTTVGQTRTDDTGKFRFRGLTKGTYEVVVTLEGRAPLRELVAMNTQNQIYEVQFYVRPDAPVSRSERSAVNVAYLRLLPRIFPARHRLLPAELTSGCRELSQARPRPRRAAGVPDPPRAGEPVPQAKAAGSRGRAAQGLPS